MTDRYVAKLNIEHFEKRLAEETDPHEIHLLQQLLAEERKKLAQLDEKSRSEQKL